MKLCLKIFAVAVIAVSTYSLIGCAAPASYSYQNVSASISAACADCENSGINVIYNPAYPMPTVLGGPAPPGSVMYITPGGGPGGNAVFTVTVNNAPATNITWALFPQPNLGSINTPPSGTTYPVTESGSDVGSFNSFSGATALYSAPARPPVWSGAALQQAQALGIPQGDVLLVASVPVDPSNPNNVITVSQLIQLVTSPTPYLTPHTNTNPAGILTPAVTIARNASYQFFGGVVGAAPCTSVVLCAAPPNNTSVVNTANNAPIWEVCTQPFATTGIASCVVGGNSTLGTITQAVTGGAPGGLYTAPATIPNPQPVVLVVPLASPSVTNQSNWANVAIN